MAPQKARDGALAWQPDESRRQTKPTPKSKAPSSATWEVSDDDQMQNGQQRARVTLLQ
eukprot:CAMPEP_0170462778 /NCGR_PEP_ID=MMETSP0123-20130129/8149_1 /TAXON_ID=182087 /ORGANISM="Favella ehrenbergii, Strain Fehren 1" /LENGTH=57 /DNA_ID=CAMNT_0010728069 /DNA_START=68 /DNA_END=241 /DNA_ORIENTATION=+